MLDFSYCECDEILADYYYQMIIHSRGSGNLEDMFKYLVNYAYRCLLSDDVSEANRILEEATKCIEKIFEEPKVFQWKKPLYEAKVLTLQAETLIKMKNYDSSLKLLLLAMKKYNKPVPRQNLFKLLKLKYLQVSVIYAAFLQPGTFGSNINLSQYMYYCDCSRTLAVLCDVYMILKMPLHAQLTGLWSLTEALKARANFSVTCEAYARALSVYDCKPGKRMLIMIETMATFYCRRKKDPIELDEFRALSQLYKRIFFSRCYTADIEKAIELGYVSVRMFFTQRFSPSLIITMVYLSTILLIRIYFQECARLLTELDFHSTDSDDIEGKVWFHAQSMLFHIIVGYTIVPYEQCKTFFKTYFVSQIISDQSLGKQRLIILLWLWCLRNERWEEAEIYTEDINRIKEALLWKHSTKVYNLFFLLEGYLLYLVHKLDQMNISEISKINEQIKEVFMRLKKTAHYLNFMKPRLVLYNAYYLYIQNKESACFKKMEKSLKLAQKFNILYVEKLGNYLIKVTGMEKAITPKCHQFLEGP
ncbi:hypothetical protein HHI36_000754 [Cryptolaemus montrouzieri]|uniref:Uncharacterized protein n=1 Tax=Cryptolaemus montrouzieri TaxID=559131 RepID=A0ABD2P5P4_9CUCU